MKKILLLFVALFMAAGIMRAQDAPLYTSLGEVTSTEGWGTTLFPYVRDVKVEGYDGYCIVRAWAGVEGYDMMVEVGEDDAVLSLTPIINGEEGTTSTKGYVTLATGREDVASIQAYLGTGYCYAGLYDEESGYVLLSCYIGDDWNYYYLTWPQGEEGGGDEWVNPFEGEATLLYSAVASTGDVEEEDHEAEDAWGTTVFPVIEDIKVDVYDKYIYIHALGGVEGYDAKVAYDASESVLSIIGIVNGEESEPCKSYIYLNTGREDFVTIQAYPGYSSAASSEDKKGYVILAAYIYKGDGTSSWNYYHISWDASGSGVAAIKGDNAAAPVYNLSGQEVDARYKGVVVRDGKKLIRK